MKRVPAWLFVAFGVSVAISWAVLLNMAGPGPRNAILVVMIVLWLAATGLAIWIRSSSVVDPQKGSMLLGLTCLRWGLVAAWLWAWFGGAADEAASLSTQ